MKNKLDKFPVIGTFTDQRVGWCSNTPVTRWVVQSSVSRPYPGTNVSLSFSLTIGEQMDKKFYILESDYQFHGREHSSFQEAREAAAEILTVKDAIYDQQKFSVAAWNRINRRTPMGWRNLPEGYVKEGRNFVWKGKAK